MALFERHTENAKMSDDALLVERAKSGDKDAFGALVEKYQSFARSERKYSFSGSCLVSGSATSNTRSSSSSTIPDKETVALALLLRTKS